jgi:hypothetical protein
MVVGGHNLKLIFNCSGGTGTGGNLAIATDLWTPGCAGFISGGLPALTAYTCLPFHLEFTVPPADTYFGLGFQTIYIDP